MKGGNPKNDEEMEEALAEGRVEGRSGRVLSSWPWGADERDSRALRKLGGVPAREPLKLSLRELHFNMRQFSLLSIFKKNIKSPPRQSRAN